MRGVTLLILGHRVKGQSQIWHSMYKTLWTEYRLQFESNLFQTSHVSCGWWEEWPYWYLVMGSKVKVNFGTLCIMPYGHNTDYSLSSITSKLHISVMDDERRNPIDFGVRLGIKWLLFRAHGAPLFFFQQCSPVGIAIFTGEDPQSEWMKRDESNRVYWFQTRFLSLVYLYVVFITKVQLYLETILTLRCHSTAMKHKKTVAYIFQWKTPVTWPKNWHWFFRFLDHSINIRIELQFFVCIWKYFALHKIYTWPVSFHFLMQTKKIVLQSLNTAIFNLQKYIPQFTTSTYAKSITKSSMRHNNLITPWLWTRLRTVIGMAMIF